MTITEFLLARIAEDEYAAGLTYETCFVGRVEGSGSRYDLAQRMSPARVLAECAAKRAIVNLYEGHRDNRDARRRPRARAAEDEQAARDRRTQEARCRVAEDAMFALAAVYTDHPDYQQEWAL